MLFSLDKGSEKSTHHSVYPKYHHNFQEKKKRQKLKDDWIKHKRFGEEASKIKEERKELNGDYYYERLDRDMNKIHFKLINF